ncbi:MAG TPA: helix-turn-helix domain-containing protein [Streptosporangiaceae bacterium]
MRPRAPAGRRAPRKPAASQPPWPGSTRPALRPPSDCSSRPYRRQRSGSGTGWNACRLDVESARAELVRMHATGEYTIADLMEVFSIGRATVYRVLERASTQPPSPAAALP